MTPKEIDKFSFLVNQINENLFNADEIQGVAMGYEALNALKHDIETRIIAINEGPFKVYNYTLCNSETNELIQITATCNEVLVVGDNSVCIASFPESNVLENVKTMSEDSESIEVKMWLENNKPSLIREIQIESLNSPDSPHVLVSHKSNEANLFLILKYSLLNLVAAANNCSLCWGKYNLAPHLFQGVDYPKIFTKPLTATVH